MARITRSRLSAENQAAGANARETESVSLIPCQSVGKLTDKTASNHAFGNLEIVQSVFDLVPQLSSTQMSSRLA